MKASHIPYGSLLTVLENRPRWHTIFGVSMNPHDEAHRQSLAADIEAMLSIAGNRRQSLRWLMAGAAALPMLGCGGSSSSSSAATNATTNVAAGAATSSSSGSSTIITSANGACSVIPEETGGPFPADGTNSNSSGVVDVLTTAGVVRSDIRSSFNGASAVAAGVPLTICSLIVHGTPAATALAPLKLLRMSLRTTPAVMATTR